jgi:uncharacterized protein
LNLPFERIVVWAHRRRMLVLIAACGIAALSGAGIQHLTFDTDVLHLLPSRGHAIPAFRTFLEGFGTLDDLYIVFSAVDGYTIIDYEDDIDAWLDSLSRVPEITRVDQGRMDASRDWGWLADHELLLLDETRLREALRRLTPGGMRASLAASRELLAVPSPEVTTIVRDDPLGFHKLLQQQLASPESGFPLLMSQDGYVTSDGTRRLVIARPAKPPYDTAFSHALFDQLHAIARNHERRTRTDPDDDRPPLDVQFGGGHRIGLEAEAVVKRESIVNGVGSLALILPFLFLTFRSLRLVAIGPLPSALSLLVALGILGFAGTTLSAAAAGASAMLFGLGVDGVVLLYVTRGLALEETHEPDAAIRRLASPAASMVLGMWTTAATFLGLLVVDFPSLEQLGLLVGASMFLCGLVTLVMVPALLPKRAPTKQPGPLTLPKFAVAVHRNARPVLIGAAVVTVILGYGASQLRVNPTLDRLRSVTEGARVLEEITDEFHLPSDVSVIVQRGQDLDELLDRNASFVDAMRRAIPSLRMQAPSALLPSRRTQQVRLKIVRSGMPALDRARADLENAATEAGFHAQAFDSFLERLGRMASAEPLTRDGFAAHRLDDVIGRLIGRDGDSWLLATYAFPETDEARAVLRELVDGREDDMVVTGMAFVNDELSDRFLPEFLKGLSLGTAMVFLLILVTFRDVRNTLLALTPTAVGLVWAAGILGFARVELDLFAIFAVITFIGIGVDYGIHMIHRYHEHRDPVRATAELSPIICVAGGITLLGYGTLVGSSYPPLRSIGMVSIVSIVTLVIASVFVLPAMLRGQDS